MPAFVDKLRSKKQSNLSCAQAQQAVLLYFTLDIKSVQPQAESTLTEENLSIKTIEDDFLLPISQAISDKSPQYLVQQDENKKPVNNTVQPIIEVSAVVDNELHYVTEPQANVVELTPTKTSWVTVYEGLNAEIKIRHYSPKTLLVYRSWMRKFQTFVKSKESRLLA